MNGSLVCLLSTCVINSKLFTLIFSSIHILLFKMLTVTVITAASSVTKDALSARYLNVKCVIQRRLFFHLPDRPTPGIRWFRSDQNIINNLVTHTHQQVAIGSASRHATMTKYHWASKLPWLQGETLKPQSNMMY